VSERSCRICGGSIAGRRTDATYCSDPCRRAATYRAGSLARWRFDPRRRCPICGQSMAGLRIDARVCSVTCRVRAFRRRADLRRAASV
jgi:predicted nucleic acid-binding Zn ribbon protein